MSQWTLREMSSVRSTPGPDRPGSGPQPSYRGDSEVSGDRDRFNDRLELTKKKGDGE